MIKFGIERRDRYEVFLEYVKRPKSFDHKEKMSNAAKERWHETPMLQAIRQKISKNRSRGKNTPPNPYKCVFTSEYGRILEHRLVMARHLGRALTKDEQVHHIDGNPRNNDLSNLALMSCSEHSRLHMLDRYKK